MSSKASLVNEKHYQAKLLLQTAASVTSSDAAETAQIKALQASAILLMHTALQLFVEEVADSCQIKQTLPTIQSLADALAQEQRSHAVVETLLELEADPKNWLSEIKRWHHKVLTGQSLSLTEVQRGFIAVQDVEADQGIEACLQAFTAFVLSQRSYLSEW